LTIGDYDGIGPEVTVKSFSHFKNAGVKIPSILVGSFASIFPNEYDINFVSTKLEELEHFNFSGDAVPVLDTVGGSVGETSGRAIELAVKILSSAKMGALVTGPISKSALRDAGYPHNGHTDFLAQLTKTSSYAMTMKNSRIHVMLMSTHVPLSGVPAQITLENFRNKFSLISNFFNRRKLARIPNLAVLSLNPHAGEQGTLGTEEESVIIPAIAESKKKYAGTLQIEGPFASDGFFGNYYSEGTQSPYDMVLAMYHDQGLIPVKQIDFKSSVNITLGLPFLRTSVDHGTAPDLFGKNLADCTSMIKAIEYAIKWGS